MKEIYRNAYRTLREGDHDILVMISKAIVMKLRRWELFQFKKHYKIWLDY